MDFTYDEDFAIKSVKDLREVMRGRKVYVEVQSRHGVFLMDAKKSEVEAMFHFFGCDMDGEGEIMLAYVLKGISVDDVYISFE